MRKDDEKRIYNFWHTLRGKNHSDEFRSFVMFRAWAKANGYGPDMILRKRDPEKPYSKENCFWCCPEKSEPYTASLAGDWDRFIDRVRAGLGMPPIMTRSPCIGCPKQDECGDTICSTRARYWDKAITDLREAISNGVWQGG